MVRFHRSPHRLFIMVIISICNPAPRCDNARGHGTKGSRGLFVIFSPLRGVRLPAVPQSITTSGCCPLVRAGTATRPRNVRGVACSLGEGERRSNPRRRVFPHRRFESARGHTCRGVPQGQRTVFQIKPQKTTYEDLHFRCNHRPDHRQAS